jgi:GH43 family beta-xylosidase
MHTLSHNQPLIPNRADPHISLHDGWYYFTASVPEYDRLELRRSKTIAGLATAQPVDVWHKHDTGPQSFHVWAPELHRIDGAWYLYYAAGEVDDVWAIRPYVVECRDADPLTGTWVEKGKLQAASGDPYSFTDFSLDVTTFEHHGQRYIVWAQKVGMVQGVSNLYIAKLETPWKLATVQVLLTTPDYDWERIGFWVNEGPSVIVSRGRVWLTFSASATGACYCMGLLSAPVDADLLDPAVWTKERHPVFATDEPSKRFGPGHNSFVVAEDGTDLLVYHARTYAEIVGDPLYNPDRHTFVRPLSWKAGRLVFD